MSERELDRAVLRVTQSPLNPLRWCLSLNCGHERWVTSKARPARRAARCNRCTDARSRDE